MSSIADSAFFSTLPQIIPNMHIDSACQHMSLTCLIVGENSLKVAQPATQSPGIAQISAAELQILLTDLTGNSTAGLLSWANSNPTVMQKILAAREAAPIEDACERAICQQPSALAISLYIGLYLLRHPSAVLMRTGMVCFARPV